MIKSSYNYLIVEDDLEVCEDVKNRMLEFKNWHCLGLITTYDEAIQIIETKKPHLLFLDYSIRGGNTFDLMDEIKNIKDYKPFIIYFTGYGSDNLFISEDVNYKYKVNVFLNKPIQEKLTANLKNYISDAEKWIKNKEIKELWLPTKDKTKVKIEPQKIICINQPENNPRYKTIRTIDNKIFDIKANWDECEKIAQENAINYFYTKSRDTLINTKYVTKLQKPFIWLNDTLKVEVTKERWKDLLL